MTAVEAEQISPQLVLQQLAPPQAVSMWPQTPAWCGVFTLLVLAALALLWWRYRRHRQALWRRQALALAEQTRKSQQADLWFGLLKRVLLVHHSRAAVAALSDQQLLALLTELAPNAKAELGQRHHQAVGLLSASSNHQVYQAVVKWISALPLAPNGGNDG